MTAAVESALKSRACSDGAFFPKYSVFKNRVLTTEYSMTMAGFPGGNDHGPEHIKRVLANLATIIGPKPLRHLNCYELFLAMMGVLYHDIGILRGRAEHAAMSAKLLADEDASYLFDDIDKGFLSSIVLNHSSTANIPETSPWTSMSKDLTCDHGCCLHLFA